MKSPLNSGENFILFLLNVFFEKKTFIISPPCQAGLVPLGSFWEVGRRAGEQVFFENCGGGGFGLGGEWEGLDLNSRQGK